MSFIHSSNQRDFHDYYDVRQLNVGNLSIPFLCAYEANILC